MIDKESMEDARYKIWYTTIKMIDREIIEEIIQNMVHSDKDDRQRKHGGDNTRYGTHR
jgi:hypothetical protein